MDPKLKPRNLQLHCITRTLPATWIVLTRTTLTQARGTTDCRNGPCLQLCRQRRYRRHDWPHSFGYFLPRLHSCWMKSMSLSDSWQKKDSFCLMSDEANPSYKIKLISAVLLVRKVQLSSSIFLTQAKSLLVLSKYQIKRAVGKTYTIPADNLDDNHEKLFAGQLPSRLVIGCVDNDAFTGNCQESERSTLNITPWAKFLYTWMEALNRSSRWLFYNSTSKHI